jgi:hypothetical protein
LAIHQRASASIAVAGQRSDVLPDVGEQLVIAIGHTLRATIGPGVGSLGSRMNV